MRPLSNRLLSYKDLKPEKGIPYSRTHVGRLEDAGRFPKRRQIGDGRVGWLEHEIDEWLGSLPTGKLPPTGAPWSVCKRCQRRFECDPGPGRPPDHCPECRPQRDWHRP
jgi:prophage regulatory protein